MVFGGTFTSNLALKLAGPSYALDQIEGGRTLDDFAERIYR
jgi:hypothetical protein